MQNPSSRSCADDVFCYRPSTINSLPTEGFDTADLKEAKALLDELGR
jgi:hypothetical protein